MRKNDTIPAILGKDVIIETGAIIGYSRLTKLREGYKLEPTIIGDGTIIRTGAVIYAGCTIGKHCHIGHNTVVREFTKMGDYSSLGSNVVVEGYTKIGHHTIIHSQSHITAKMTIGNYVFIGPNITTANDRKLRYHRPEITEEDEGPTVEDGVIIGAGAHILPKVHIGIGAFVAMGALITKDVRPWMLVMGVPAKEIRKIERSQVVSELLNFYEGKS
jgi:acetyltransferase-like isoleucine patch superfamily enzyme